MNGQLILRLFAWTSLAVAAGVAARPATAPERVYAIETIAFASAKADLIRDNLRAMRALHRQFGVELVGVYQIQFGEDISKVVEIWSAADAEVLRRAFGAKDVLTANLQKMILSDATEVGELNPVPAFKPVAGSNAANRVFSMVRVTIDPAQHDKFVSTLRAAPASHGSQGVNFIASYHIQLGERSHEIDFWAAADAETIRRSFFAPTPESNDFDEIKASTVELVEPLQLD